MQNVLWVQLKQLLCKRFFKCHDLDVKKEGITKKKKIQNKIKL